MSRPLFVLTWRLALLLSLSGADQVLAAQSHFINSAGLLNVGWQDNKGEPQQLSYQLAAGALPPLIAYRPARMQEEIWQSLLREANDQFPEVQFSLARPAFELSLKSRHQDKAQAAMAWVKTRRAELEQAWLRQYYFQYFIPPDGSRAIKQDHVRIALESRSELAPLADLLKQSGATELEAYQNTTAWVLDFVQNIPYLLLDEPSGRGGRGLLTPRQVLEQNSGDCDSKVTLMAALLAQLFPELPQIMVFVPGHALLGVALPVQSNQESLMWEGQRYLLMEPTGPAELPPGQLATSSKVLVDSGQLSIQAVRTEEVGG